MGELERFVEQVARIIERHVEPPADFHPGKVSVWIKLVRFVSVDGAKMEETVGTVHKLIFVADTVPELIRVVAENMVLVAFGSEVQLVREMPNLIVKLFDQKRFVPIPGAPPLDEPDQLYLKATIYEFRPSLWDQLSQQKPKPLPGL